MVLWVCSLTGLSWVVIYWSYLGVTHVVVVVYGSPTGIWRALDGLAHMFSKWFCQVVGERSLSWNGLS